MSSRMQRQRFLSYLHLSVFTTLYVQHFNTENAERAETKATVKGSKTTQQKGRTYITIMSAARKPSLDYARLLGIYY